MIVNKFKLNADKTETILFNSSKLQHPPAPLSICQDTMCFSDSVRNLGFYLNKDLSMKEYISFICKTAFLEIWHNSTIRHYPSDDAIDYCNSLFVGVPQSLVGKLQRVQNSSALPIRLHASVMPSPPPPLLIFLTLVLSFSISLLQCRHSPPQNSTL